MPKQIIRHQCDFCHKKAYANKYDAARHEKKCFFNPAVRSCITCSNLTISANCLLTQQLAFSKGHSIRHCKDWKAMEPFEDELMDDW